MNEKIRGCADTYWRYGGCPRTYGETRECPGGIGKMLTNKRISKKIFGQTYVSSKAITLEVINTLLIKCFI